MRIIVLCGGVSPEREVSLRSGAAVCAALKEAGYESELCDITSISSFVASWKSYNADGVYIALHGGWGENGEIQAVLKAFNIPFTGSSFEGSMLSMDKNLSKLCFASYGLRVPEGFVADKDNFYADRAEALLSKYGRIIVKPNNGGSTIGVTQVTDIAQYAPAVRLALESDTQALIEQFIAGEEVTVPVMENEQGEASALPVIHIKPKVGYYDYTNKYTSGNTEYICPSDLPEDINKRLADYAVKAHKSLGCRTYSRVDFRVTETGECYALEVNTAPGMTATSLVPKAARAAGWSFPDFLDTVIKNSFNAR